MEKVGLDQLLNEKELSKALGISRVTLYGYRKLGEEHWRHALNYFWLASQRIRVSDSRYDRFREPLKSEIQFDPFNYGTRDDWGV